MASLRQLGVELAGITPIKVRFAMRDRGATILMCFFFLRLMSLQNQMIAFAQHQGDEQELAEIGELTTIATTTGVSSTKKIAVE